MAALNSKETTLSSPFPSSGRTPLPVDVIVRPLSTVEYTSVASLSTVDSGLTNLIHDRE